MEDTDEIPTSGENFNIEVKINTGERPYLLNLAEPFRKPPKNLRLMTVRKLTIKE